LEKQLSTLLQLLPDIQRKMNAMKPDLLLKLMNDKGAVANRLLALKTIFPSAGVSLHKTDSRVLASRTFMALV
jgi:hypothetical protein